MKRWGLWAEPQNCKVRVLGQGCGGGGQTERGWSCIVEG